MWRLYIIWRSYLCDKCLLEDTAATPTMGLFGKKIEQYVVMYNIHAVESSVLKGTAYLHRRVMKPSTAVSSCWKAKMFKCGVTCDREFAFCVLKSHIDPRKRGFTSLGRSLIVTDSVCKRRGSNGKDRELCVDITLHGAPIPCRKIP